MGTSPRSGGFSGGVRIDSQSGWVAASVTVAISTPATVTSAVAVAEM